MEYLFTIVCVHIPMSYVFFKLEFVHQSYEEDTIIPIYPLIHWGSEKWNNYLSSQGLETAQLQFKFRSS